MRLRISPSALGSYKHCQLHFKLSYIDKLKPVMRGTIYSVLGVAVHDSIDHFFKQFKELRTNDLPTLLKIFEETFAKRCQEQLPELPEVTFASFVETGKKMLTSYHKYDFEEGNVNFVLDSEKKFVVDCGDFDLVGIVDRSYKHGEVISVTDYKTGAVRSQKDVDSDDQLSLYSWMYWHSNGVIPDSLCLYFLKPDKRVYTTRTQEQLHAFYNKIVEFKDKVMAQTVFEPNFKGCAMCDFKFNCPESEKKKIRLT